MRYDTTSPEEEPLPPSDELDRLEQVHRGMKEEQAAWRKLLESLAELKKRPPETPKPETPTP